ncbi:uncharacterized protein BCR38DRAFT_501285 [Pseudomassariella vexata]|uniref:RING-type domain-containing protein n=1 Tax=Pseudomassariella vexata TaxID=1141098 RepID=A0A1Y2DEQ0_9PEZI|nr:uncharacterized protein BCR38DRAFT_501285 [Pseudomassariella vexata]ORY57750.1 hypothetical protein BCR38DRAFT_501285 [Pseudomassariella vexata]
MSSNIWPLRCDETGSHDEGSCPTCAIKTSRTLCEIRGTSHEPTAGSSSRNVPIASMPRRRTVALVTTASSTPNKMDEPYLCPICKETAQNQNMAETDAQLTRRTPRSFVTFPCQHAFHPDCIVAWIQCQERPTCPYCRKPLYYTCKHKVKLVHLVPEHIFPRYEFEHHCGSPACFKAHQEQKILRRQSVLNELCDYLRRTCERTNAKSRCMESRDCRLFDAMCRYGWRKPWGHHPPALIQAINIGAGAIFIQMVLQRTLARLLDEIDREAKQPEIFRRNGLEYVPAALVREACRAMEQYLSLLDGSWTNVENVNGVYQAEDIERLYPGVLHFYSVPVDDDEEVTVEHIDGLEGGTAHHG